MAILVLVGLGAFVALGHFVAALYLANRFTRSPRRRVRGTPADTGLRYEEVQFHAADRVALRGWFIESPGARAVVAVIHDVDGTRADPERGLLSLQREYVRRGFHVLAFDLRGRGESAGSRDLLGGPELLDVVAAVAYAGRRAPGLPVLLHGFGLGASLALAAAAAESPVAAVIADSPLSSMREQLQHRHPRVPRYLLGLGYVLARRLFGADVDALDPMAAVASAERVPVLFVCGEQDDRVPPSQTLNLAAASLSRQHEVWVASEAGHCEAFVRHPEEYLRRSLAFIELAVPARLPIASAV
jgi:alpha-beta hydrolase superfamily lysophospholipase